MSKLLTAIGMMSGTSLDGIDVALLRTDGVSAVERGPSRTYPYDEGQRLLLKQAIADALVMTDRAARPGCLARAECQLTEWNEQAVRSFIRETGGSLANIDIIGFHGQTVIHRPERRLTVQLGDGPALARGLGVDVIYDLRAADVAEGGQGAPLVPVYHQALAGALAERPAAFVNIGGVANITWIGPGGELMAFDTGPGNALLNDWCEKHVGEAMDRDGKLAARGAFDSKAYARLAANPYFESPIPKSLDRNAFDVSCLEGLSVEDGAATLIHFTAASIACGVEHLPARPKVYVICGGGRHNPILMGTLRGMLEPQGARVIAAEAAGFNGDAMEAEAWAYLAVRSLKGLPITYPGTTKSPRPMTGGVLAKCSNGAPHSERAAAGPPKGR